MHACTSTECTTNAALQTNTVTCNKQTRSLATNKRGHLQTIVIHKNTHRWAVITHLISQKHTVTGMYRGSPPPPLPSLPGKKRSGSASLSRPKTSAVLAQVGVSRTVNPTNERGTPRATPKPLASTDRRHCEEELFIRKLTWTRKKTSAQTTPRPVHLKTLKAHLVAKINLHLTRPAESPSVERHKAKFSKEAFLTDVVHASTTYLLVSALFFFSA